MNEEQNIGAKKKLDLAAFGKALAFFAMEILAIVAFSLGNSFVFYSIAGLVLVAISVVITRKQITKDGISSFAFILFPIFVYGVLSALSYMRIDPYFDLQNGLVAFVPFGLAAFSAAAYFLSLNKEFKIKNALIVIYSAVAILTLINLFATLIDFGFFHTIIFKGKYLYYDGKISECGIQDMAMGLMGFKMSEISIRFFSMMPTVLVSAFIPLFFINRKENRKSFILYLCFGLIGLIALILMPNVWTLLTDILVVIVLAVFILMLYFKSASKIVKNISIVIGVIVLLGLIFVTINAQTNASGIFASIKDSVKGNAILNKLFNDNRFIIPINCSLDGLFSTDRILGTPIHTYTYTYKTGLLVTGSWLFDSIYSSGLFGLAFLVFIIAIGIRRMVFYYRNSDDVKEDKVTVIAFVITFLTYTLVNFDMTPYVFKSNVIPMYENGLFLIVIFLLSYCFAKSDVKKEVPVNKEIKEKEMDENEEIVL